jgi:hypothetical protein
MLSVEFWLVPLFCDSVDWSSGADLGAGSFEGLLPLSHAVVFLYRSHAIEKVSLNKLRNRSLEMLECYLFITNFANDKLDCFLREIYTRGTTACIAYNVLFRREETTWRHYAVKMDLKEISCQGIALVHLVYTRIHKLIVASTAMNIRVP